MTAALVFLLVIVAWVLVSGRLSRRSVTGPIAMTVAGLLVVSVPFGIDVLLESERVKLLIELTLAVVLFGDASTVGARWFATEWRYPARLLGIGLPLTILCGTLVAWWIFPGTDIWVAFVVAAALAPTDAALGTQIIEDERIPLNFRQIINVESGLNDGLATPVVAFAIAGVIATDEGTGWTSAAHGGALAGAGCRARPRDRPGDRSAHGLGAAVRLGAPASGPAGAARRRRSAPMRSPVELGGNGFVAAFVAGVAYGGTVTPAKHEQRLELTEDIGLLLGFAVWFLFGAALLSQVLPVISWQMVVYAVLSLTVLRMVPVAVSAAGARLLVGHGGAGRVARPARPRVDRVRDPRARRHRGRAGAVRRPGRHGDGGALGARARSERGAARRLVRP